MVGVAGKRERNAGVGGNVEVARLMLEKNARSRAVNADALQCFFEIFFFVRRSIVDADEVNTAAEIYFPVIQNGDACGTDRGECVRESGR